MRLSIGPIEMIRHLFARSFVRSMHSNRRRFVVVFEKSKFETRSKWVWLFCHNKSKYNDSNNDYNNNDYYYSENKYNDSNNNYSDNDNNYNYCINDYNYSNNK